MDIATLQEHERRLVLDRFDAASAVDLGLRMVTVAREENMPIVIDIRTSDRTLFHAALPGSTPLNALWARRKSNATLMWQESSLLIGARLAEKGEQPAKHGLADADYAVHGGSFPVRVAGVGVVAAVTVSGLPSVEDHALVVRSLDWLLQSQRAKPAA